MPPASLPERHRRESYDGLELASDAVDLAETSDFVVGLAQSPTILARLTIRRRVRSALDLGTGGGIQALLAARHAERVVAVDVNPRALEYGSENAGLNGIENVEWRLGSWLEPVAGERFELIVANPPYVISPERDLLYRDSGEPGDALVRRLLAALPDHLEEGGYAHLLCNWVQRGDDWRAPLEGAIAGRGCDAVLLMYRSEDGEEYARGWNRWLADRDHRAFERAVGAWLAHYREHGIETIAFGAVVLRRRSESGNWLRAFKVPAAPTERGGEHVERLFSGWDWVRTGAVGPVQPAPGARVLRRRSLNDESERITLEVRPNAGFAARLEPEVADAIAASQELPAAEAKRLVGLGLLVPA